MFYLGPRHFGTLTAYVIGPDAASYRFTSGLPVQILKSMGPLLLPHLETASADGCLPPPLLAQLPAADAAVGEEAPLLADEIAPNGEQDAVADDAASALAVDPQRAPEEGAADADPARMEPADAADGADAAEPVDPAHTGDIDEGASPVAPMADELNAAPPPAAPAPRD